MAGQPAAFVLLLGMGLRHFSMSPAFVPRMKKLASVISLPEAEAMLQKVLQLKTTGQIKRYMAAQVARRAPDFTLLDSA